MAQSYPIAKSNHRPTAASMPSASQRSLRALIVCQAGTTPQPLASPTTATMAVFTPTVIIRPENMRALTARGTRLVAASSTTITSKGRSSIRETASLKV